MMPQTTPQGLLWMLEPHMWQEEAYASDSWQRFNNQATAAITTYRMLSTPPTWPTWNQEINNHSTIIPPDTTSSSFLVRSRRDPVVLFHPYMRRDRERLYGGVQPGLEHEEDCQTPLGLRRTSNETTEIAMLDVRVSNGSGERSRGGSKPVSGAKPGRPAPKSEEAPDRKHVCERCNKAYIAKQSLKRHDPGCKGEKPFPCGGCDKSFTREDNRGDHWKLFPDHLPPPFQKRNG